MGGGGVDSGFFVVTLRIEAGVTSVLWIRVLSGFVEWRIGDSRLETFVVTYILGMKEKDIRYLS